MSAAPLRVRQIPAAHAYVEHLRPLDDPRAVHGPAAAHVPGEPDTSGVAHDPGEVVHLADPPVPGAPPGQWWPHPALEAGWVREHADEQDLVHLHFGTEGRTVEELAEWLGALRSVGLPLVHTVHDIDHPQLVEQARHREHLALLVAAADGLLTLTEGAADVIEREHGCRPLVVPHPHVAPLDRIGGGGRRDGVLRVGIHLKSLRANLAPMLVLPALVAAVDELRRGGTEVQLEVRAHHDALDPAAPHHDPRLAAWWSALAASSPPGVRLVLAPRLDDEGLWDYLAGLDVSVLPYAWATHSGWVEACRDLGTLVLAPRVGHLVEQGAGSVLTWGDPGGSPETAVLTGLLAQVTETLDRSGGPFSTGAEPVTRTWRQAQRTQIAATHAWVYAAVVAGERVDAMTEALRPTGLKPSGS